MSTRGIIARVGEHEGEFLGRYTHSDSMPSSRGPLLIEMLKKEFAGDLKQMLAYLIDEHRAGWSSLIPEHRACYCHPQKAARADFKHRKAEPAQDFTHKSLTPDTDIEWLYVFDVEHNTLCVRDVRHGAEFLLDLSKHISKRKWTEIECGGKAENWARCGHYAWAHGLAPKTCNLSTRTFLGLQPLDFRDAIAFVKDGIRYEATGSGGNSDYMLRSGAAHGQRFPRNSWVSSVKRGSVRLDIAVAKIVDDKYIPLPGVQWVMPPTKDNPRELVVS
jgi:hypothetical protein